MKKIIYLLICIILLPIILAILLFLANMTVTIFGIVINLRIVLIPILSIVTVIYVFWKMRKDYKTITESHRTNYWTIVTNVFLVLFTFWMGIFVQDLIARKNTSTNDKLVRIQYVDNIFPELKSLWEDEVFSNSKELLSLGISNDNRILDLQDSLAIHPEQKDSLCKLLAEAKKDSMNYVSAFRSYLLEHKKDVVKYGYKSDSIVSKYIYYVTDETLADSIRSTSSDLRVSLYAAEL